MANFLAPIINDQQENSNGAPLSGGTIEVYLAGSSTPATTYSDQAGLSPNTWPIVLNTLGVNNQGAVWLLGGFTYKFVIKDSTGVVQRTIDNVQGINDLTAGFDQWVLFPGAPTYVSATSFTVAGDQTQIFQASRRVKTTNTGGTVYSTIASSAYVAPNTTITVRNDSGALDSGLSQVSYGLISIQNSSVTGLLLNVRYFTIPGATVYTPTPGTTWIEVEIQGAGGGSAGTAATSASQLAISGNGAAGSWGKRIFRSGFVGATITVGTGGAAGALGGGGGGSGGISAFGGALTVPGGGGSGAALGATGTNFIASGGTTGGPPLARTLASPVLAILPHLSSATRQ
ncbi:MAG: hypothetical protein JSS14_01415 [Proteobacteria bacterium]|nr:hypothetical protein [Pseudomonadota bacterium]